MPVKIIDNSGTTDVTTGEVTEDDLAKMKHDFDYEVDVTPINPRNVINKRISFLFSRHQFIELLNSAPDADLVKINVGVQVPGTKDICGNNEEDSMSAVVEMAIKDTSINPPEIIPIIGIGSYVLINGYQDNGEPKFGDACCPSSDPGHPGHP